MRTTEDIRRDWLRTGVPGVVMLATKALIEESQTDLPYSFTGYAITSYFRSEVNRENPSKMPPPTT